MSASPSPPPPPRPSGTWTPVWTSSLRRTASAPTPSTSTPTTSSAAWMEWPMLWTTLRPVLTWTAAVSFTDYPYWSLVPWERRVTPKWLFPISQSLTALLRYVMSFVQNHRERANQEHDFQEIGSNGPKKVAWIWVRLLAPAHISGRIRNQNER